MPVGLGPRINELGYESVSFSQTGATWDFRYARIGNMLVGIEHSSEAVDYEHAFTLTVAHNRFTYQSDSYTLDPGPLIFHPRIFTYHVFPFLPIGDREVDRYQTNLVDFPLYLLPYYKQRTRFGLVEVNDESMLAGSGVHHYVVGGGSIGDPTFTTSYPYLIFDWGTAWGMMLSLVSDGDLKLIVQTPEGDTDLVIWDHPGGNDVYNNFNPPSYNPSGLVGSPLGSYDCQWELIETGIGNPTVGDDPPSNKHRKFRARYRVWKDNNLIFDQESEEIKSLWEWMTGVELPANNNSFIGRNQTFYMGITTASATKIVYDLDVIRPEEEHITTTFEFVEESEDWTALSVSSFEWNNPANTGNDPDFNSPDNQEFAFDIQQPVYSSSDPQPSIYHWVSEIRNKGISTTFDVTPFTFYRLEFVSGNSNHPFLVIVNNRVVFHNLTDDPDRWKISNRLRGNHILYRRFDIGEVPGDDPDLKNRQSEIGFYFWTRDETLVKVRWIGYTFRDYPELRSGKISGIELKKISTPQSQKTWTPYPYTVRRASSVSPDFSCWVLPRYNGAGADRIRIEVDRAQLPGVGPWVIEIAEGSLPFKYVLANGIITVDQSVTGIPSIEDSGFVAFLIIDANGSKFRTAWYHWLLE
jgi:hypothetical protein